MNKTKIKQICHVIRKYDGVFIVFFEGWAFLVCAFIYLLNKGYFAFVLFLILYCVCIYFSRVCFYMIKHYKWFQTPNVKFLVDDTRSRGSRHVLLIYQVVSENKNIVDRGTIKITDEVEKREDELHKIRLSLPEMEIIGNIILRNKIKF